MAQRAVDTVMINEADLFSGASEEDARVVVKYLAELRPKVANTIFYSSDPHGTNVNGVLVFADAYRTAVLEQAKDIEKRVEGSPEEYDLEEIRKARTAYERALDEQAEAEARVEEASNRLRSVQQAIQRAAREASLE